MAPPYKHGYVAAYSRADAIRAIAEALGYNGLAMDSELRNYWSEGAWGNTMIGIKPERGLWATKADNGEVFRILQGNAIPVTERGPEWAEFKAKEQAKYQARREREEREQREKCERIFRVWQKLNRNDFRLYNQMRDSDTCKFEHDGHDYEVREVESSE